MSTVSTPRKPRQSKKAALSASLVIAINHVSYGITIGKPDVEFGSRSVRLAKCGGDRETWDVLVAPHGMECSCPDWIVRHADDGSHCKHIEALLFVGLIEVPTPPAIRLPLPEDFEVAVVEVLPQPATETPVETPAEKVEYVPLLPEPVESFSEDLLAAVQADEFTVPEEVDADSWMTAIITRFRKVAPRFQLKFAARLSRDWETPGKRIRPLGPSLEELEVLLQERKATLEAPKGVAISDAPCCDPSEAVPCSPCAASHAEPIGWPKPARRSFLRASTTPAIKPRRPALLPDGQYSLSDLAEAQAAFYAGWGNAVGDLFAQTMRTLASDIKATNATSVADFESRLEVLQYDAFADGFRQAELQAASY